MDKLWLQKSDFFPGFIEPPMIAYSPPNCQGTSAANSCDKYWYIYLWCKTRPNQNAVGGMVSEIHIEANLCCLCIDEEAGDSWPDASTCENYDPQPSVYSMVGDEQIDCEVDGNQLVSILLTGSDGQTHIVDVKLNGTSNCNDPC
jgi:hypothetical protein